MTYADDLQPVSQHPQHILPPRQNCNTCTWLHAYADDSLVRQSNLIHDSNGNTEDREVLRLMAAEHNALMAAWIAHTVLPHRP